MRFQAPLRVSEIRHGDKEQKLKDFILHSLRQAAACANQDQLANLLVVARSLDSPIVRAITALRADIASAGLGLRMILAQVDQDVLPEGWLSDDRSVAFD